MDITYDADTDTMQSHTRRYVRERGLYVPDLNAPALWTPTDSDDVQRAERVLADLLGPTHARI